MRSRLLQTLLLLICIPCTCAWAQGELGIVAGISNYQGELTSYSAANGFKAKIGPVIGVHAGYELNKRFQLRGDLLYLRLSGDDKLNNHEISRARNLNFFSPVFQLAGGIDWNILGFSQKDALSFSPYASLGVSLFHMNPKTTYQGKKIALHPLGTEGQYLSDYPDQKPYSLLQPSIQLGGGLKVFTTGKIIIALEAMMSYSFTDYIDDVSTIYITYDELLAKAGLLTAALANRQGEYLNAEPVIVPTGALRGNDSNNDFFGTITIRFGIPIEIRSNQYKVRHKHGKTIHCPQF
ncbi:MAG: DUF6089 family protein [Saprospiraceae bacterium]